MKTKPAASNGIALRTLARWHRSLGLAGALFVLLLTMTGVLINHGTRFSLEKRYVESTWFLDVYGIDPPPVNESFRAKDRWVTRVDKQVYLDARSVAFTEEPLIGVLQQDQTIVLATSKYLLLLDLQGNLLDKLGREHGAPAPFARLGKSGGSVAVLANDTLYHIDLNSLSWTKQRTQSVRWSEPETLPAAMQTQIGDQARRRMLSWDRAVRELHSGRILGSWGVWLMDVIAFVFLLLTVSGIWVWWRARREFGGKESTRRPKHP